jgi:hypothetical protein
VYQARIRLEFQWSPAAVLIALVAVELGILALDVVGYRYVGDRDLRHMLDMNLEGNIATFFASMQALLVAMAALALSTRYPGGGRRCAWIAVALFFAFIAVDDASQIHKRVASAWGNAALEGDSATLSARAANDFPSYALDFKPKSERNGVRTWRADTRDNPRYRSVRALTRKGRVVGLRVVYREPNVHAHDVWRELLSAPYRFTDEERHWETEDLKLKARRDATAFYVVRKRYRNRLEW